MPHLETHKGIRFFRLENENFSSWQMLRKNFETLQLQSLHFSNFPSFSKFRKSPKLVGKINLIKIISFIDITKRAEC